MTDTPARLKAARGALSQRLREPDTFTIGELKRAAKKFTLTLVQLMGERA